jgi:omega-amidase
MNSHETRQVRIALAQIDVELGNIEANVEKAARFIEQAASQEADLILLPELWTTGYDLENSRFHADANSNAVLPELEQLARKHRIVVVGSLIFDNGQLTNSATVIDSTGKLVGSYSKIHLFAPMEEHQFLTAGNQAPIFELPFSKIGVGICYDLRFPELFRKYALNDVLIVLVPAEWPASRIEHWRTLIRARAIENQYFVAACNRVGVSKEITFGGHSTVVDPHGSVLVEGDQMERLLIATLDLRQVDKSRGNIATLKDRRPDVYHSSESIVLSLVVGPDDV